MEILLGGVVALMWLAGVGQLVVWGIGAYFRRAENRDAREFLENQLLAEAEALRAATRNREASQAVLRG